MLLRRPRPRGRGKIVRRIIRLLFARYNKSRSIDGKIAAAAAPGKIFARSEFIGSLGNIASSLTLCLPGLKLKNYLKRGGPSEINSSFGWEMSRLWI